MYSNSRYAHEYRQAIASASLAKKLIEEHFGDSSFTRKEYTAIAKKTGAMAIETLEAHKFVTVCQTDTFEIKVKPYDEDEWMEDQNGNLLMKRWEYFRLPEAAKKALTAMNGGKELAVKMTCKTTVEAKRFHYVTNWGKLDEYATAHKGSILKQSQRLLEKAQKQVAIHTAVLDFYNELL